MSNPGVINLKDGYCGKHFVKIEDNLGEAIHIHFDDMRIDLSIKEFYEWVHALEKAMNNLLEWQEIMPSDIDSHCLLLLSEKLLTVKTKKVDCVSLNSLRFNYECPENQYFQRYFKSCCNETDKFVAVLGDSTQTIWTSKFIMKSVSNKNEIKIVRLYFDKKTESEIFRRIYGGTKKRDLGMRVGDVKRLLKKILRKICELWINIRRKVNRFL